MSPSTTPEGSSSSTRSGGGTRMMKKVGKPKNIRSSSRSVGDPEGLSSTELTHKQVSFSSLQYSVVGEHQPFEEKTPFIPINNNNNSSNIEDDEVEKEEAELFTDTFSFLMTAKYPFEKARKSVKEEDSSILLGEDLSGTDNDGSNDKGNKTTAEKTTADTLLSHDDGIIDEEMVTASTKKISKNETKLQNVDEDWMYLPFWLGLFILVLQMFIYTVVLIAQFQTGEPSPSDMLMRLAQGFALMVALYTQSDLVDSIFMLTEGPSKLLEVTTPLKFTLANICRLVAGNVGLVASFSLIIYAQDVVDLLLNFTAVEFVATLDDAAFHMATKGFLGINLEKKAKFVEEFRYEYVIRKRSRLIRFLVYLAYFCVNAGALIVIVCLQRRRQLGVDNVVYVQFDDTEVPQLFGISGVYKGCLGYATRRDGRIYTNDIGYVDVSWGDKCPELIPKTYIKNDEQGYDADGFVEVQKEIVDFFPANSFYYCKAIKGWVYIKEETSDPCDASNYIVRSSLDDGEDKPSDYFDILTHTNANWLVQQPHIRGESFLDSVFITPVGKYGIDYNCTGGVEAIADLNIDGTDVGTFRANLFPLPGSSYPSTEDELSYFEEFNLVYRQVFFRSYTFVDEFGTQQNSNVIPTCDNQESIFNEYDVTELVMFDGLRWHYIGDFNLQMFVDYANEKYQDAASEKCAIKTFLTYFLRNKSWMLNDTIAVPSFISDPMIFMTPGDTGVPSRDLNWYEVDFVLSEGIVQPGRSTNDEGRYLMNFELRCLISAAADCNENELPFNLDLATDRYPQDTAILVKRNPSLQNMTLDNPAPEQDVYTEYISRLEGSNSSSYEKVDLIPVEATNTVFSLSEPGAKDFRFDVRETRYQLQSCVPFEYGSTFCLDVTVLNTNVASSGIIEFILGYKDRVERFNDGDFLNCLQYSLCHLPVATEATSTSFVWVPFVTDPKICDLSEFAEMYPGLQ